MLGLAHAHARHTLCSIWPIRGKGVTQLESFRNGGVFGARNVSPVQNQTETFTYLTTFGVTELAPIWQLLCSVQTVTVTPNYPMHRLHRGKNWNVLWLMREGILAKFSHRRLCRKKILIFILDFQFHHSCRAASYSDCKRHLISKKAKYLLTSTGEKKGEDRKYFNPAENLKSRKISRHARQRRKGDSSSFIRFYRQ